MILFVITAVIYIGVVIFIAQLKAPTEYNIKENTISELACQTYENRNIMQWGFKGFGIILLSGIVINWISMSNELHFTIPLVIYALGILLSGFFSTKPFEHLVFYKEKESKIHSFCAQLAGFGVSILVLMKFIMVTGAFSRVVNLVILVFILFTSARTVKSNPTRGLFQRALYFGTFMWLIYAYSGMMK